MRNSKRGFLIFGLFLVGLMSLSKGFIENVRAKSVGLLAPAWQGACSIKKSSLSFLFPSQASKREVDETKLEALEIENHRLHQQLERLAHWLLYEHCLEKQRQIGQLFNEKQGLSSYLQRRSQHLAALMHLQLQALPASVIFRPSNLWNSCVWLGVGKRDNAKVGRCIVEKNSPVVVGNAVVGVVEEVHEDKCRVRLITDANLNISVRVARGDRQQRVLQNQIEALLLQLNLRAGELPKIGEVVEALQVFKKEIVNSEEKTEYLAKGHLQGSHFPSWRNRTPLLKGVGFNCDFPDEEGLARHLRTGALSDGTNATPLIKVGDLLVTTGLDGVFPADLEVATVTKILPLREGGCAYECEAMPFAAPFDELQELFILPPSH